MIRRSPVWWMPWLLAAAASCAALCAGSCAAPEPQPSASATGAEAVSSPPGKVEQLDIVDRAIEAHGGPLVESSRVRVTVTSKSGSFDIETSRQGDVFEHRISENKNGSLRVHRQTNDALELTENGEPVAFAENDLAGAHSYVNQRVYFLFLPYKMNDPGTYKEDLGLEVWDGRELRKVRVSFQPGTSAGDESQYMYWFDPETARLEQFAYDYSAGTGLRFRKLFNYREVGGITFYDAENYGLNTRRGGLGVDLVTPEYAAKDLPLVSTIELSNIEVEAP